MMYISLLETQSTDLNIISQPRIKQLQQFLLGNQLLNWTQFYGSAYRRILCLQHHSPLTVQAPNFCASCVNKEYLIMWSMHPHKQKFPLNPTKNALYKHKTPCCNRFFAYDKQSHEIGSRRSILNKQLQHFLEELSYKCTLLTSALYTGKCMAQLRNQKIWIVKTKIRTKFFVIFI